MNKKIISQAVKEIKSIKIQGATNIAIFSLKTLVSISNQLTDYRQLVEISRRLALARPDEPLTQNILSLLLINQKKDFNPIKLAKQIDFYLQLLKENKERISSFASQLIKPGQSYFSHCHSSSLENAFVYAFKEGKKFKVYQTETRPLYQGHITARHLYQAGLDVTLVVDDLASWLVSTYDNLIDIQAVFIGADVLSLDGWALNKVGSFSLALSASKARVPFYVVASLLKFTSQIGRKIKIERRSADEIWPDRPGGLKVLNLAFDKTPAEYITGIVTEVGIIKPEILASAVAKTYPGLKNIF